MQPYRIYFRHRKDGIVGRDDFEAEDDRSGMAIAAVLCDACGDVCDSDEPWQGVRRANVRCDDAGARAGRRFDMRAGGGGQGRGVAAGERPGHRQKPAAAPAPAAPAPDLSYRELRADPTASASVKQALARQARQRPRQAGRRLSVSRGTRKDSPALAAGLFCLPVGTDHVGPDADMKPPRSLSFADQPLMFDKRHRLDQPICGHWLGALEVN